MGKRLLSAHCRSDQRQWQFLVLIQFHMSLGRPRLTIYGREDGGSGRSTGFPKVTGWKEVTESGSEAIFL